MGKTLLRNEQDFDSLNLEVQEYLGEVNYEPIDKPERYPCVACGIYIEASNGREYFEYCFVYPQDFYHTQE